MCNIKLFFFRTVNFFKTDICIATHTHTHTHTHTEHYLVIACCFSSIIKSSKSRFRHISMSYLVTIVTACMHFRCNLLFATFRAGIFLVGAMLLIDK